MSSTEPNPFSATAFSRQQQLQRNVNISSRLQSTGYGVSLLETLVPALKVVR